MTNADSVPSRSEIFEAANSFRDLLYTVTVNEGMASFRESIDVYGPKEQSGRRTTKYFEDRVAISSLLPTDEEKIIHEAAVQLSIEGSQYISRRIRRILSFTDDALDELPREFEKVQDSLDRLGGTMGLSSRNLDDKERFGIVNSTPNTGQLEKINEVIDNWESDVQEQVYEYFSSALGSAIANHRNMADLLMSALEIEVGVMRGALISIGAMIQETVAEITGERPLGQDFRDIAEVTGDAAIFAIKAPKIGAALTLTSFGSKSIAKIAEAYDIKVYSPITSASYDQAISDLNNSLDALESEIARARDEASIELRQHFEPLMSYATMSDSRKSLVLPGLQYIDDSKDKGRYE